MQIQQLMQQLNQQFAQPQPESHMGGEVAGTQINYPEAEQPAESNGESINPQSIEAVSGTSLTNPASTGGEAP